MTTGEKVSVFLAMPVYRVLDAFTAQSLIKLVAQQMSAQEFGLSIKMHIGECPIGRARNDLSHAFLESNCTHILFVDSDIIFSYEQVRKIAHSGEDIVGGFYTKKQEGHVSLVCNTLDSVEPPRADGLTKVKYMGTGFLCISRKVFEVMIQEMGKKLEYLDDRDSKTVKHDFWRMGVARDCVLGVNRWLSEDWQFCQFSKECGFEIWADASIMLQHSGMAIFPLSYQEKQLYSDEQLERMKIAVKSREMDTAANGLQAVSPQPATPVESIA